MASISRERRSVKPLAPVSVTARWLKVVPVPTLEGSVVAISDAKVTKFYAFSAHLDQQSGEVLGYRFQELHSGDPHDVSPSFTWGWGCDCEDGTYRPNRPGGCRHIAAAQQLLDSLDEALERQALEAEQEADCGEWSDWYSDDELQAMAAEAWQEERARLARDDVRRGTIYGPVVGA